MSWQYDDQVCQLWAAVHKGEVTLLQQLVYDDRASINTTDRNGNTLLHDAAKYKKDDIVKELIEAGVDINAQNENGQTALHLAADRGHAYTVLLLLENGSNPDIQTAYSEMTALHLASRFGHHQAVRLLVDAGADVNVKDTINKPAEFYAATDEVRQIFQSLRNRVQLSQNHDQSKSSKFCENDEDISSETTETCENRNENKTHTNTTKHKSNTKIINHKLEFSENHQKRMRQNVFSRLASKK